MKFHNTNSASKRHTPQAPKQTKQTHRYVHTHTNIVTPHHTLGRTNITVRVQERGQG
ncbi:uncharacterized protein K452DRAFT_285523 [Aplosporella prunicola CBS 121167]|uniref:Uncharacterized protein n=1 Tax=Aplosporella prunicola CBS 121167 TaxID=1176127 RepID=A0A6A6BLX4_9PEZI|nr:uncharacterized protein K452DRAFT_285523 [Aplosporella prunicola CBS 121167]KAF2144284.1 hypothetical protein K452DRAFT_285523 [Aplosporella prunicola CBS 121167]